jgi:hypothetical protein
MTQLMSTAFVSVGCQRPLVICAASVIDGLVIAVQLHNIDVGGSGDWTDTDGRGARARADEDLSDMQAAITEQRGP